MSGPVVEKIRSSSSSAETELVRILEPHGVAVHLSAMHLCTQMRGVREDHSRTLTSFWRGNYDTDPQLRTEFLQAVYQPDH